jgi:hypothetical protein
MGENRQTAWEWSDPLGDLDVGINENQFESQISLNKLETSESPSVYFHIIDWELNGDYSDKPIMAPEQAGKERVGSGLRGVQEYLVINELLFADEAMRQFIEIANPTLSPLGVGWYITCRSKTSENDVVILEIPCNIPAPSEDVNAVFYSYCLSPNTYSEGDLLKLWDDEGKLKDCVEVPSPWNTISDSYERYKCPSDGKPYDTDKASDWKITPGNSLRFENPLTVPEFPTELFIPITTIIFIAICITRRRRQRKIK